MNPRTCKYTEYYLYKWRLDFELTRYVPRVGSLAEPVEHGEKRKAGALYLHHTRPVRVSGAPRFSVRPKPHLEAVLSGLGQRTSL